ncbi:unnamed protein product [Prorocentrum cordatum]|uniref:Sulfhydryl oxidase n=1 Tax=Prorocentrum cordatum TaxID=2364126 RepID=A0ABN9SQ08_9DINO|nr:unnamed protein product [Polarella glacialis]
MLPPLLALAALALALGPARGSRLAAGGGGGPSTGALALLRPPPLAQGGPAAPPEQGAGAQLLGLLRRAAARGGLEEHSEALVSWARHASLIGGGSREATLKEPNHFRNPHVWGPVAWFFLHDVAFAQEQEIPDEQQEKLRFFFTDEVADIMPCDECQTRTRRIIKSMQPIAEDTWSNRTKLIMWVIMFHNHVNLDMEKQVLPPERVLGHYVAMFDRAEPVAITFDPSTDSGRDPQEAFPTVWHAGGMKTPEIIRFRMPKVWGPVGWFFLQTLALAQEDSAPANSKAALVHFYTKSLSFVLPCPFCGMHLRGHLDEGRSPLPTTNMTRSELARWVSDLHNVVNREKKEPSPQFPWAKVVVGFNGQYELGPPIDVYLGNGGPLRTPSGGHAPKSAAPRRARARAPAAAATLAACLLVAA